MKRGIFRGAVFAALMLSLAPGARASQLLIPVGRVVGLSLRDGSVTVAAFDDTLGQDARKAGVQIGDDIVSVNGQNIDTAADLNEALRCSSGSVTLELCREGESRSVRLEPPITENGPRLGVYVREGITGIGTVTYYDPSSGSFGALGHGISTAEGQLAPMRTGAVYQAQVEDVRRGKIGAPGQLKGAVASPEPIGSLSVNTAFGVFGSCESWDGTPMPTAEPHEIQTGPATILSNVNGDCVETFDVEIVKLYQNDPSTGRDLMLRVTDPDLLKATGGIVAGMSGSPIIQDGKLVGAVTHVLVNDPTRGYGIFIENMLDAAG